MKQSVSVVLSLLLLSYIPSAEGSLAYRTDTRGPVRASYSLDEADPNARPCLAYHNAGSLEMTLSNWGVHGNPDNVPGYHGFMYPIGSGNDFLFSAGIWIGADVGGQARVTTTTDGDNGTGEMWPVHIGTIPSGNQNQNFADWYFSSSSFSQYGDRQYVWGRRGVDDDGDWTLNDDLNGNGLTDRNWDGGAGRIGRDDDDDGLVDEEQANNADDDGDGRVDEDTGTASDSNHDGICDYDPEPHVDEDPAGDMSSDRLDNDHDGLVDTDDPDFDGDLVVGFLDDDSDGVFDEDAAARAYQEFYAVFQDSISPQYVRRPSGPHVPLNIEVVQHSYAFSGGVAGRFIYCDYIIRNLSAAPLQHLYISLFADPDILAAGEGGDAGSLDDWNYFDAAHVMAVQGDDTTDTDGQGPGVFAMKVIRTPVPHSDLRLSFASYERVSGGDPWLDADKYLMMSSGQIDPPTSNEGDWRMVVSFGDAIHDGFSLAPAGELLFTVAYLAGDNRADVTALSELAEEYFYRPDIPQAPSPPRNFRLLSNASGTVSLSWSPPILDPVIGYIVGGIDEGGEGDYTQFGGIRTDTVAVLSNLIDGDDWLFEVVSLDTDTVASLPSQLLVRVNAPNQVQGAAAVNQAGDILVTWQPAPEPNVVSYHVRRIQSWPPYADTANFTLTGTSLTDESAVLGHEYEYRVAAINSDGITGFWSDPATATPWAPGHRLLVFDEYTDRSPQQGGVPRDSIRAHYVRILNELGAEYDYCTGPQCGSVDSLALYDRVLWVSENRSSQETATREDAFQHYLQNGGKLLRIARRFMAGNGILNAGRYRGSPQRLLPMQFDSVHASNWTSSSPGMQFVGANTLVEGYPDVTVDQNRLDSLHFAASNYDYLPEVDVFWPRGNTQPLYQTQVLPTDSSGLGGSACAVYSYNYITLAFPLYFLPYEQARDLLDACLFTLDTMTFANDERRPPVVPMRIALHSCYPNPFNSITTIAFDLPAAAMVRMEVFNVLGQKVDALLNERIPGGSHSIRWDGSHAASGLYIVRLEALGQAAAMKMLLLK